MEKFVIVKLISCCLIWTTLMVENDATIYHKDEPKTISGPVNATGVPKSAPFSAANPVSGNQKSDQNKTFQNQNASVSNEQKTNSNDIKKIAADENAHSPNSRNNHKSAEIINSTSTAQKGEAEALRNISIYEEKTQFSSKTWIYITLGVLCVAFINFYVFWYRKRAATYSFAPKLKTQRR